MISGVIILVFASAGTVLVVLLWRRIFAEAQIPPEIAGSGSAAVDTQECRLAVHEAGHAVAGWCCTLVGEVTVATIEDKNGGLVSHSYYAISGPEAEWCEMVIALAGVCAEAMVYSRWSTRGSERDLMRALTHAERIGADGLVNAPWDRRGPEAGSVPNFNRMFKTPLSSPALANLEEGYRMTRHVLRSHGSAFFKMVSLLLTKRAVTRFDMERVLGKRRFETLIAVGTKLESVVNQSGKPEFFKPRFVLPAKRRKKAA
jgi:ATP-dependent Zn protease